MASCPAHDDRTPSLSLRELEDDFILVNCFAGCEPEDVLAAIGLTYADLYPNHAEHRNRPSRDRVDAVDALSSSAHEGIVVVLLAEDMANGKHLSDADSARLIEAAARLRHAADLV